ncbi:MAG: carbohydrate-binding family 9-like protein [Bryobacterales bacterium]|nr:carbohydrate-binding family 9-like protein [Bryobacterales bacterium]
MLFRISPAPASGGYACLLVLLFAPLVAAQQVCTVASPTAEFTIPHVKTAGALTLDPDAGLWKKAASAWIVKDCTRSVEYPETKTEVRAFYTGASLYFLFICPYQVLNLWLPPQNSKPRVKLWDRDVVEIFLGDDWKNIRHYREFEIAPTGDWIDLAIDLDRKNYDRDWRSGWQTMGRIDEARKIWYAAARIPLKSVSEVPVKSGTRWRMNLYRIDGQGPDSERHFLCWQPTCVLNRDPNHVPEHFGTLVFR